jgi:hypothetical protein
VLRVHVGEGYPRKTKDSHRGIAQQNVQKLVARLELMAENRKAEKAIRKFEAGEIGIPDHQKKVIYFYDENLIPD